MMKTTGKKSLASIIKIFLIILFILCIASMIVVPIFAQRNGEDFLRQMLFEQPLGVTVIFIYISSIPALIMLYEFIKIFSSIEKGEVFTRKIETRFLFSSICSIIIGIIYGINVFVVPLEEANFEYASIVVYLFFSIITAMIFLIFGIGLLVLREIYKTAISNKEENDLTI